MLPRVSGFSIIRNGDALGYPYREALRSLAPYVDEIVLALGDSHDTTRSSLEVLRAELRVPLKIFDSPWDAGEQKGGRELSRQTNLALARCAHDICFYIQGDEVLPDGETEILREDIRRFAADEELDALALRWVHFYGNFETIVESKQWYRREVRVIKKSRGLQSFGDAQGFRLRDASGRWTKASAALSRARMFHYGWVRPPDTMAQKSIALDRLWHGHARDHWHSSESVYPPLFGMKPFTGQHPAVMKERVEALRGFDPFRGKSVAKDRKYWRLWLSQIIESACGWRPGEFTNSRYQKFY